jgi:hypothetical protein
VQKRLDDKKNKQNKLVWIIIAFVILVLLLLSGLRSCYQKERKDVKNRGDHDSTAAMIDTVSKCVDIMADTVARPDSLVIDTVKKTSIDTALSRKRLVIRKATIDSAGADNPVDSGAIVSIEKKDSLSDTTKSAQQDTQAVKQDTTTMEKESLCSEDTTQLWIYPDPSGGLHRLPQKIRFFSNRSCTVYWRMKGAQDWITWDEGEIVVEKTGTVQFSGVDTCGKQMELREEYYEIEKEVTSICPEGMAHVAVGEASFCADIYEWPNKKGARPMSYVSLYQASDSCFSVGKRLCTADEWLLACSGPFSYTYPYGNSYEERACVTADTIVKKSGETAECRSYFGLYDMSGNLQEWTDTRSSENGRFNYVNGGFWNSGIKSSCRERRYSYFSQNKHNPVGFRCCSDIETAGPRRKK